MSDPKIPAAEAQLFYRHVNAGPSHVHEDLGETFAELRARLRNEIVAGIADPAKLDAPTRKKILDSIYQTDPADPVYAKVLAQMRDVGLGLDSVNKRVFDVEQTLVRMGVSPTGDTSAQVLADRVGVLNERLERIESFLQKVAAPQPAPIMQLLPRPDPPQFFPPGYPPYPQPHFPGYPPSGYPNVAGGGSSPMPMPTDPRWSGFLPPPGCPSPPRYGP